MELNAEDKQRIEEEERRRVAEEQYRAEVRSKMRQPRGQRVKVWILAVLIVILGIAIMGRHSMDARANTPTSNPTPRTREVPVVHKVAEGETVVSPGGLAQYPIEITPDMQGARVVGKFTAFGGGGNDIIAVIADESNYMNWANGHQSRVYWQTQGQQTTGNFSLRLAPGTYYLGLSNKFSAFTQKQVMLNVSLYYTKTVSISDDAN